MDDGRVCTGGWGEQAGLDTARAASRGQSLIESGSERITLPKRCAGRRAQPAYLVQADGLAGQPEADCLHRLVHPPPLLLLGGQRQSDCGGRVIKGVSVSVMLAGSRAWRPGRRQLWCCKQQGMGSQGAGRNGDAQCCKEGSATPAAAHSLPSPAGPACVQTDTPWGRQAPAPSTGSNPAVDWGREGPGSEMWREGRAARPRAATAAAADLTPRTCHVRRCSEGSRKCVEVVEGADTAWGGL